MSLACMLRRLAGRVQTVHQLYAYIPGIVRTIVGVDDEPVIKPNEAICNLSRIRAAAFQGRQQLSVVKTSKNARESKVRCFS